MSENKLKHKKIILVIAAVIIGLLIIMVIINLILQNVIKLITEKPPETQKINYLFFEPNYEDNIFEDEEYLEKNRYIEYTNGAVSITLADGNFSAHGRPVVFFNEYFNTLMNGDAEKYNTYFSEDYYKDNKRFEKFTMQKIYNINITVLLEEVVEEGKYYGYNRYLYKVSYMIMKNDGTFRDDIDSDGSVPLVFEILEDYNANRIFINSISKYTTIY